MSKSRYCTYQSERLPSKSARRKARQALKSGREPKVVYRTGKFWID